MVSAIRQGQCSDSTGIAQAHVSSWRTTYRELMPADFLANLNTASRARYWHSVLCLPHADQVVFVAEDAAQIVGFATGGPERSHDREYTGELYAIYLLDSHQRQGLGRRLLLAIAEELARREMHSLLIWVLTQNPARAFYEKLGGQAARTQLVTIGDRSYEETGYGWLDTGPLLRER